MLAWSVVLQSVDVQYCIDNVTGVYSTYQISLLPAGPAEPWQVQFDHRGEKVWQHTHARSGVLSGSTVPEF